jgi:hypothetical protein
MNSSEPSKPTASSGQRNTDLGIAGNTASSLLDTPNPSAPGGIVIKPAMRQPRLLDFISFLFVCAGLSAIDNNYHFLRYNGADHVVLGARTARHPDWRAGHHHPLWGDDRLDGGCEASDTYGGDATTSPPTWAATTFVR